MPRINEAPKVVANFRGVYLLPDATQIEDNQFRKLQNTYPPRGSIRVLAKRPGSVKYNASALAGVARLDAGIRGWKMDGTSKLLVAANLGAGDKLYVGNDGAGTFAEITGGSAAGANLRWSLLNWPLLGKAYFAPGSGGTPIQVTADFATKADINPAIGDAQFGAFIITFHQRIVTARTPTNPNFIYALDAGVDNAWTGAYFDRIDDPITALGKYTFGTTDSSLNEMLIAWGPHSMWYRTADFSSTTSTIQQASRVIGCKSPKSIVNTPIGLMFLASDRMVYLLRSDPREPEKVAQGIFPDLQNIPEAQLADACAVYHDGFYKLAFAPTGGTANTLQYWADLLPVMLGAGTTVDWYGPHVGLSLLSFVLFDGPADALDLYGLDDTAGTAWHTYQKNNFQDGTQTIVMDILTKEYTEGDPIRQKIWAGLDFGYLKTASGLLSIQAITDQGGGGASGVLSWTLSGAVWDGAIWDVDLWSGTSFQEDVLNFPNRVVGRTLQLELIHAQNADFPLRDFTRKVRVINRVP